MFRGIRIIERMTTLFNEQGDKAVFTIAEWIEELQEKNDRLTSELKTEKLKNLRLDSTYTRQVERLLKKIDRMEEEGYFNGC